MTGQDARRSRRTEGQSLVEFAMLLPVLLSLFVGVYTASGFISDRQVAGQAARAAVRLGAEFGGTPPRTTCQPALPNPPTNPCGIDAEIIQQAKTIAKGIFDNGAASVLDEIDIYQPCATVGVCSAPGNLCSTAGVPGGYTPGLLADIYTPLGTDPDGTPHFNLVGFANYPLNLRKQNHPAEGVIGVRIVYTFSAPVPLFRGLFDTTTSEYATMCFAPLETS